MSYIQVLVLFTSNAGDLGAYFQFKLILKTTLNQKRQLALLDWHPISAHSFNLLFKLRQLKFLVQTSSGRDHSTGEELTPHDQEALGLNPTKCLAITVSIFLVMCPRTAPPGNRNLSLLVERVLTGRQSQLCYSQKGQVNLKEHSIFKLTTFPFCAVI